jgi:DNA-binding beta-propeller fold protein YncE
MSKPLLVAAVTLSALAAAASCSSDPDPTLSPAQETGVDGTTDVANDTPPTEAGEDARPEVAVDADATADAIVDKPHEVWIIDQSDSVLGASGGSGSGGFLYIYKSEDLAGSAEPVAEKIDLGGATRDLCQTKTSTPPVRPHMLLFTPSGDYGVISFVASGHVVIIDAKTRAPVECIDVGVQAHAAYPSDDGKYILVANQNGKLLQRIASDWAAKTFTLEDAATLNLAAGKTPSGADIQDVPDGGPSLRPDNAPICPILTTDSKLGFVTLRGGGLFVVDPTTNPISIVAEYDRATVAPNGCGGVQVGDRIYINSGGGTAANPFVSKVYAFDLAAFAGDRPKAPNTPAPKLLFERTGAVDSHGAVLVDGRYVWFADRAANLVEVVDSKDGDKVLPSFGLAGALSSDPAPDLLDISPSGTKVYAALRGLNPLTANAPDAGNAVGNTPGLGVIAVEEGGKKGSLVRVIRIRNGDDAGVERADPHGIRVRLR